MRIRLLPVLVPALWLSFSLVAPVRAAAVEIRDDQGAPVTLREPAERVIALAPHLTELVFAAGAGDTLVGVSSYSDYPDAARRIPEVGDAFRVDMEQILALRPDLVLVWASGTPREAIERMRGLGLTVAVFAPRGLEDVAAGLRAIGRLTGHADTADRAAESYLSRLAVLRTKYAGAEPVRVFFEISSRPLYTVNGEHIISNVIELCGGRNIFADLDTLSPAVGVEAVLARNPQAIVGSGKGEAAARDMLRWLRWQELAAARATNLFLIPPEYISRATPRLLEGAEMLCEDLEEARGRLPAGAPTAGGAEDAEEEGQQDLQD